MICFEFKGGIGTATKATSTPRPAATPWVCSWNAIAAADRSFTSPVFRWGSKLKSSARDNKSAVIIIVISTDAPLLPHQLKRLARRATMGLARNGSTSGNGSGDIFIVFTTVNAGAAGAADVSPLAVLPNERMNPLFDAVVQATEEAIVNALFAAETITGINSYKVEALPIDRVQEILKKYNRLKE